MAKSMTVREVVQALRAQHCRPDTHSKGSHDKWLCPCGQHTALIPRHRIVSPGVVRDTIRRMSCLEEGWLQ